MHLMDFEDAQCDVASSCASWLHRDFPSMIRWMRPNNGDSHLDVSYGSLIED